MITTKAGSTEVGDQMFRVMLIRPSGRFNGKSFPDGPWVSIPNGLLYVSAAIEQANPGEVEVRVLDALATPDLEAFERATTPLLFGLQMNQILDEIRAYRPRMVGVTAHSYHYFRDFVETIQAIRAAFPDVFLFGGGPDMTADHERYFEQVPYLSAAVLGEGEETTRELVTRVRACADWRDVRGIAWRRESDGVVVKNPAREWIRDLDHRQPDYDKIDLEKYFRLNRLGFRARVTYRYPGVDRTVDIVTSRGCPYPCTFCSNFIHMGRAFRPESVPSVIAHMQRLIDAHGVRHFHFEDDVLTMNKQRFRALLESIIERDWRITWDTPNGVRVDSLDEEILALCRRSGCSHLIFGAETGSPRMLAEVMKKGFTLEDTERAAELCWRAEIDTLAYYIVGSPGERVDEIEQTYEFAFKLMERWGVTPLLQLWRPLPGTDMYEAANASHGLTGSTAEYLHEKYRVPFVSFKRDMHANPQFTADDFGRLHARWERRIKVLGARKWARILAANPHAWPRVAADVAGFVFDPTRSLRDRSDSAKARLFDTAAYPFSYVHRLGEVWEDRPEGTTRGSSGPSQTKPSQRT